MPYNPAGVFSLVASYFATPGTTIQTTQHNPPLEDVASALSQVLLRDGRAPMTGPLNMNGFQITDIAPGTTPTSVATVSQSVPIGVVLDFAGDAAPAGYMLCAGQAVSRVLYPILFDVIGTKYGAGDGSTTFNLPDAKGRVTAGKDNMGGTAAGRLTSTGSGIDGVTLGAAGGTQSTILGILNLPPYTPEGFVTSPVQLIYTRFAELVTVGSDGPAQTNIWKGVSGQATSAQALGFSGVPQGGIAAPFGIAQPTLVQNKIIRVSYDA